MKTENLVLYRISLIFIVALILFPSLLAHESDVPHEEKKVSLPSNLQAIQNYNSQQAQFYFKNLSFLIAFLAGILGILTPCSFALLPAFFAFTFKEKNQITKMTFAFFLGFTPIFILFGLIASLLGLGIATVQQNSRFLIIIAGILIIIFGLMTLFGKGFKGITIKRKTSKSFLGIFLFGIFFALGFTACSGPILIGILLIAGILQSYLYAMILMLFYSFGLFVPIFLMSFFFDKYNFLRLISKINARLGFSITNLIAGLLLIIIGLIFIIYGGTFIIDNLGLGSFTALVYSMQNNLLSIKFINIIGFLVLITFIIYLFKFLRKRK